MLSENKKLKIAVLHDHLGWCGGAERTALIMAIALEADFITVYANSNTYPDYQKQLGNNLVILKDDFKILNKEVLRFLFLRYIFWLNRHKFTRYDILIASGQAATEAISRYSRPEALRILYNHTPPRRFFDLYQTSRAKYKWFLRPFFSIFAFIWRGIYLQALNKINIHIANSENIRERSRYYTKQDVDFVVWPPIETERFTFLGQSDYYLSWARLDEHKRVDLIVQAFQKMPDKKLIVASGGEQLEYIKRLAKNYPNIQVVGWQSEEQLKHLVGNCLAAIYIPVDEDAGMTQLEANAAGKPVLGVDEGGLRESIIHDLTGIKIQAQPSTEDIIVGVNIMTKKWCLERKEICIKHAKMFDKSVFIQRIRKIVLS